MKRLTLDVVTERALSCKTRGEFKAKFGSSYNRAWEWGILDEVCKHMPKDIRNIQPKEKNPNFKYSDEEIFKKALEYTTRSLFDSAEPCCYRAAIKRGILELACAHMKKRGGSSPSERDLFNKIRVHYPNIKKMYSKAIIQGKPHIKGFHLDVYIPELHKGIEFDGTYWHSFDGLAKTRLKYGWPQEDIKNYHQIKDDWFASKGIQILHIKEEDWLKNSDACLRKCLDFFTNHRGSY